MECDNYVCILVHGDECVNNGDCKNCDYGADEKFFIEDNIN